MGCVKTVVFVFGVLAAVFASGIALGDPTFEHALSLATEKRYAEAREALDPLLQREPDNRRARVLHGVLRAREGRVGEAIDIFEALGSTGVMIVDAGGVRLTALTRPERSFDHGEVVTLALNPAALYFFSPVDGRNLLL